MIAIIDIFSRFLELYPAVDTSAISAADAILQHIGRYGVPSLLISDAGSQYVNEVISQYLSLMGTDHHITLAYSKQEYGIIERGNKEILRHTKAIIFERSILKRWTKNIVALHQERSLIVSKYTKLLYLEFLLFWLRPAGQEMIGVINIYG